MTADTDLLEARFKFAKILRDHVFPENKASLLLEEIKTEDDLFWFLGIGQRYGQSEWECEVLPKIIRNVYQQKTPGGAA